MKMNEVIQTLKLEAATDDKFAKVCDMLAARERSRSQMTLKALDLRMKQHGHPLQEDDYRRVIKVLADLGFGTLETDSRKRPSALKGVKVSLASIGEVALGRARGFKSVRLRNRFYKLPLHAVPVPAANRDPIQKPVLKTLSVTPSAKGIIGLTLVINNKPVNISVTENLTANEIATLVQCLRQAAV